MVSSVGKEHLYLLQCCFLLSNYEVSDYIIVLFNRRKLRMACKLQNFINNLCLKRSVRNCLRSFVGKIIITCTNKS